MKKKTFSHLLELKPERYPVTVYKEYDVTHLPEDALAKSFYIRPLNISRNVLQRRC